MQKETIEIDFENGQHYDVTISQNDDLDGDDNDKLKEAEIEGDGFVHPDWVKAKVYTVTPEQIERARAQARELEKDVKEVEEKKPLMRPVSLVKLGIGFGAYLMFFILFPLFVYGMRKVVVQVREWRKPRFY